MILPPLDAEFKRKKKTDMDSVHIHAVYIWRFVFNLHMFVYICI